MVFRDPETQTIIRGDAFIILDRLSIDPDALILRDIDEFKGVSKYNSKVTMEKYDAYNNRRF